MKNTITWFEINVANLERSIKFYNHVLETEIRVMELDDFPAMGIFPEEGVKWRTGGRRRIRSTGVQRYYALF